LAQPELSKEDQKYHIATQRSATPITPGQINISINQPVARKEDAKRNLVTKNATAKVVTNK
jgi:hypothetical protein